MSASIQTRRGAPINFKIASAKRSPLILTRINRGLSERRLSSQSPTQPRRIPSQMYARGIPVRMLRATNDQIRPRIPLALQPTIGNMKRDRTELSNRMEIHRAIWAANAFPEGSAVFASGDIWFSPHVEQWARVHRHASVVPCSETYLGDMYHRYRINHSGVMRMK